MCDYLLLITFSLKNQLQQVTAAKSPWFCIPKIKSLLFYDLDIEYRIVYINYKVWILRIFHSKIFKKKLICKTAAKCNSFHSSASSRIHQMPHIPSCVSPISHLKAHLSSLITWNVKGTQHIILQHTLYPIVMCRHIQI